MLLTLFLGISIYSTRKEGDKCLCFTIHKKQKEDAQNRISLKYMEILAILAETKLRIWKIDAVGGEEKRFASKLNNFG